MADLLKEYHASHDCDPGQCVCKCGCTQMMGCRALSGLCSQCHVASNWDDTEHGFKSDGGEKHE